MDLANSAGDLRRRDAITDPPAGHRISLGHRIDDHRPLAHAGNLGHRDVRDLRAFTRIENVLVNLVSETKRIELLAESGDKFHLSAAENFPRGIVWIADDDGPGL